MTEIFTAKTVDEAKALAVKKFGKRANEIRFEVIDEGRKGFLGMGSKNAKVKATYIAPASKPMSKPAPIREEPKPEIKPEPVKEESQPEIKPESVKEEPKLESKPEQIKEELKLESNPEQIKEESQPEPKLEPIRDELKPEDDDMNLLLDEFTLIEDEAQLNEKVKIARDYIISVLKAMNVDAEYIIYQNETGALIDIKSDNNGTIIGRRGETLDSLQYLCSIIANKGDKDYFRITIDCLGYRNKRKETLRQLASKVAKSVLKSGRSQQLEPMNPYERRVIHSAISEIEGVSSRSVGEEPYRKIIISSNNPKAGKRRTGGRRDDRKNGRRNDRKRREPIEVKEMDLSTSFEKDYKKPKPEDSMDIGLYGKIEL